MALQQTLDSAAELHRGGRRAAARALYQQVLREVPDHPVALHLMGVLAAQEGDAAAAVEWIRRAIRVCPVEIDFHVNLTLILQAAGRHDEVRDSCQRAVTLAPGRPDLRFRYGNILRVTGHLAEAIVQFQEALRLDPRHADAHNNLGAALAEVGRPDEALGHCRQAISLAPHCASAQGNLGNVLKQTGQIAAALAAYRRAMSIEPADPRYHSHLVSAMNFDPAATAWTIREELDRWNRLHAAPLAPIDQPRIGDTNPERQLRIGYVSPNFSGHVIGRNLLPLIRHHDRGAFEVHCYSSVAAPDDITRLFEQYASHFHPVAAESDAQLARRIQEDRIDILVDVTLHLEGCRLGVFARKTAPIQVTFAGYPGSTGLSTVDFRLTDPHLDPPGQDDGIYAEKSVRLPATFWCYENSAQPPVNDLPALALGRVTFGSLGNFSKVNDGVLALWARVLGAVPGSRLALLSDEGSHRGRVRDLLAAQDIAPERVMFFPRAPRQAYFEMYHQLDIGLDTVPYNGHTTSLDSLYMGVPVVSLVGATVVGRAGVSLLTNLKLPGLIARTPEEYVRIAVELARDLPRLRALRLELRRRMQESCLMDAPRFARDMEAQFRAMWREHAARK